MPNETPQLTESEVAKVEERDWFLSAESLEKQVALTITERDALVRDWRALKAKNETLGDVGLRNAQFIDRIRVWSKCADGYPLDEHINNIATENERLREERAKAIKLLSPDVPRTDLCDAARQIVFAHALERGSAEKLQTQNAALREQLAHVTASLEELRGLRDKWLALLNPTSADETVEGAIRNLQQAYTSGTTPQNSNPNWLNSPVNEMRYRSAMRAKRKQSNEYVDYTEVDHEQ